MTNLPVRDRSTAKLAGVCAALARTWGVDPVLVRVAVVILAAVTSGFAVAAYLLLWATLPVRGGEPPVYRWIPASRSWSMPTLIAVIAGGTILLGVLTSGSGPGALAVLALTWVILRFGFAGRRRSEPEPAATLMPTEDTPFGRAAHAWQRRLDNLDAGRPLDWEPAPLPPRMPPELPQRRSGRAWFGILATLGVVWTAASAAGALGSPLPPLAWASLTLLVLGLALVWSSRPRRAVRGRPLFLVPATLMAAALTAGLLAASTPDVVASLRTDASADVTTMSVGSHIIDLSDATVSDATRSYQLGVGDLVIVPPSSGNVVVHARAGVGDVATPEGDSDGVDAASTWQRTDDPDGPTLVIEASVGIGEIEVRP